MPVLYYDKDKDKKAGQEESSPTNQQVLGGSKGSDAGLSGGTVPQKQGTSSGSFTNLQSYLKAAEGQNFGKEVAGKVRGVQEEAGKGLEEEKAGFGSKVTAGTTYWDKPDAEGKTTKSITEGVIAAPDPESTDFTNVQNFGGVEYSGPDAYTYDPSSGYGQIQEKAQQYVKMSVDPEQRGTLLKDIYGSAGNPYTKGMQGLDSILMGANPNAFAGITDTAAQQVGSLQDWMDQSADLVQGGIEDTTATREGVSGAIQGAYDPLSTQISDAATSKQTGYADDRIALENALATGDLTGLNFDQMKTFLGMTGLDPRQQLWNTDLSSYMPTWQDTSMYSKEALTSDEDYNKLAALNELGGMGGLDWEQASMPNSYLNNPYQDYQSQQLGEDLVSGKAGYNQALQDKTYSMTPYGGTANMNLVDALEHMGPYYSQAKDYFNSLTPEQQAADQSGATNTIRKYKELEAAREEIRTAKGYYNQL